VNPENIRKELERLNNVVEAETDTGIRRAIRHRIADLERMLEKLRADGKDSES
jgi:hypothetical protein